MPDKVISQIKFEISQIDELLNSFSTLLIRISKRNPDLIEITALASVLHSFYNGLESIFLCIGKGIDHNIPTGERWHRDLLNQMGKATQARKPVLTSKTIDKLAEYLAFRHFYRHSYSFYLEWEELKKLVIPIAEIWQRSKSELEEYLESLRNENDG